MRIKAAIFLSAIMLAACGDRDETVPADPPPVPPEAGEAAEAGGAAGTALAPGTYCYFREDADTTEALEILVTEAGEISGTNYGSIHQEEQAYYASFEIELTSGVAGADGDITFDSVTQVDGDTQTGPMTWSIAPDAAAPDGFVDKPLQPAECDGLEDLVFPPM